MKIRSTLYLSLIFLTTIASAQNNFPNFISGEVEEAKTNHPFTEFSQLFSILEDQSQRKADLSQTLKDAVLMNLNTVELRKTRESVEKGLQISVPISDDKNIQLELIETKLFSDGFNITTETNPFALAEVSIGKHYQGVVKGYDHSLAAISFFEGEIAGIISFKGNNYTLGKIEENEEGLHVLYKDNDFLGDLSSVCSTTDELGQYSLGQEHEGTINRNLTNCVNLYLEVDHDLYVQKGSSLQNTTEYVTGLMNQVITLYNNESITLQISELKIWNNTDPYTGSSTGNYLDQFRANLGSNYNGDLAHLIGVSGGGGVAYVDVLCFKSFAFGYSAVNTSYNNVPTYSWSVSVLTHELGHNLGSPHTHACAWNGNGTAYDGCGPAAGYSEGCNGPLPNSGTIMSYCHLVGGVGIDFANGFGDQPGDLIRLEITNASCLGACSSCTLSSNVNTTDPDCQPNSKGSASVNATGGTPPYSYAWSTGGSGSSINNLDPGNYNVTVSDAGSCSEILGFTINSPTQLVLNFITSPESLPGSSDGSINLTIGNGTPPFSYSWSNGANSQNLSGLSEGTYSVVVTDAAGCSANGSANVGSNSCENVISNFPYFEGFESGFGDWVQSTDDDMNWTRRSGSTPSRSTGPASSSEGNYYVYTEASGNSYKTTILESPCFNLSNVTNPVLNFDIHMYGSYMGSISVDVSTDNGQSWSSLLNAAGNQGNLWYNVDLDLSQYTSSATKIRFFATIGYGYRSDIAIDKIEILGSTPPCNSPFLFTEVTDVSCKNKTDGSAEVFASGGTPPYTYAWSNGSNNARIENIGAGTYSVVVTDAGGCSSETSVSVTEPTTLGLTFSVDDESGEGNEDGSIDLSVSGGTPPYSYNWSTGASTQDIEGLSEGTYDVVVTDANGCIITATIFVDVIIVTSSTCDGPTKGLPYVESFENGFGDWVQSSQDDFDWFRKTGSTPSRRTGPTGATDGNYYIYTEASGHYYETTILESPCFDLSGAPNPVFQFDFHMYGSTMGTLDVELSTNGGDSWELFWSLTGNQGNSWYRTMVDMSSYSGQQVKIRYIGTMYRYRSDISIDNVQFYNDGSVQPEISGILREGSLSIFPSPASDYVQVEMYSDDHAEYDISIIDAMGRVQFNQDGFLNPGDNSIKLDISDLSNGVLFINTRTGEEFYTQKIIKQER